MFRKLMSGVLVMLMIISMLPIQTESVHAADGDACSEPFCEGVYINGFCTENSIHYEPAIEVTSTNYAQLGLTADYIGYYAVENGGQLYYLTSAMIVLDPPIDNPSSANIVLLEDITINDNVIVDGELNDGQYLRQWSTFGEELYDPYKGTFDGQGHTLSGIYIHKTDGVYTVAPFDNVQGATIKNLGIIDSFLAAKGLTGGIVGNAENSTIENCYSEAILISEEGDGGGVVGNASNSTISNCYYTGSLQAYAHIGAILGANDASSNTVTNCFYLKGCATSTNGSASPVNGIGNESDVAGKTTGKTAEEFASGEVAYLLNNSKCCEDVLWYQTIGTHSAPGFTGKMVHKDASGNYLNHQHNWVFTKESDTKLSAACDGNHCDSDTTVSGGTIEIAVPDNLTYTGAGIEPKITNQLVDGIAVNVTYTTEDGTALTSAPVGVGTYKASITLGGETIRVTYRIEPKELLITDIQTKTREYDGTKNVKVTEITVSGVAEMDDVAIDYANVKATISGANAGTYDEVSVTGIALRGADAENYRIATGATVDAEIVIHKADPEIGEVTAKILKGTTDISKVELTRENDTVAGTFTIDAGQTLKKGDNEVSYTFTPEDTTNYKVVKGTVVVKVESGVPNTGDYSNIALWCVLMIAGLDFVILGQKKYKRR